MTTMKEITKYCTWHDVSDGVIVVVLRSRRALASRFRFAFAYRNCVHCLLAGVYRAPENSSHTENSSALLGVTC